MGPRVFFPGHIQPAQGAANSIPMLDLNPQHRIISVAGTLTEGDFTPINRNIDPSGRGCPEQLCSSAGCGGAVPSTG